MKHSVSVAPLTVTIIYSREWDEYRIPHPRKPGDDATYYADDRQDAIDTARYIHGQNIRIVHRRVD